MPDRNLSKRSQALRRHGGGDAPAGMAPALGIRLQEVDLLPKVHRMVIKYLTGRPPAPNPSAQSAPVPDNENEDR